MIGLNETWRKERKILDGSLRPSEIMSYQRVMQEKIRELLVELRANPKDFENRIELLVGHSLYVARLLTARQLSGKNYHVTHIRLRHEGW